MPVKSFYLFAAFFICLRLYPQMTLDVTPEPKPLEFVIEAMSPAFKVPVKKVTWIKRNDTLDVYHVDKKGNEVLRYNYYNNKRGAKTATAYTNGLKTETRYTTKSDEVVTTFKYNAAGNYTEWGKKTTYFNSNQQSYSDFRWLFEYDAKGNVIKKYKEDAGGVKTLTNEYTYDDANKVQQAVTNGQWISVFEYNDKGLLKSRAESLNGQVSHTFQYDYDEKGNLKAQYTKYYAVDYVYDEAGKLVNCVYTYTKDGTKEGITFFYEGNKLTKALITRDGLTSFSPFIFPTDYMAGVNNGLVLKVEFIYDSHNNITEIKHYVNDDYKFSSRYVYEYY
jgi:YD repeat-containing protein